jgi:hypothetical protein
MATVTRTIATLVEASTNLQAIVEIDYDDVQLEVNAIRCVNNTSGRVDVNAVKTMSPSFGRLYQARFPGGRTTFIGIPNTPPSDRVPITIDAQGRVDGIDWQVGWAPG